VTGLDHVLLNVGPESVLGSKDRPQLDGRVREEPVGGMTELAVNRRRIADDADSLMIESRRIEQAFETQPHAHG